MYFEPVSGHILSPLALLRDRRKESEKEEGPHRSISLMSILSTHKPNSTF
jgi:hypothetical protein